MLQDTSILDTHAEERASSAPVVVMLHHGSQVARILSGLFFAQGGPRFCGRKNAHSQREADERQEKPEPLPCVFQAPSISPARALKRKDFSRRFDKAEAIFQCAKPREFSRESLFLETNQSAGLGKQG